MKSAISINGTAMNGKRSHMIPSSVSGGVVDYAAARTYIGTNGRAFHAAPMKRIR